MNTSDLDQFLLLDNQIVSLNKKLKELREKRSELETKIMEKSETPQFQYNGNKFRIAETRVPESLTFKYLEKSLSTIIKNPQQVETIISFIRTNREIKTVAELKRIEEKK
jgi:hypothetical protein